jgi:hypothetical protein
MRQEDKDQDKNTRSDICCPTYSLIICTGQVALECVNFMTRFLMEVLPFLGPVQGWQEIPL